MKDKSCESCHGFFYSQATLTPFTPVADVYQNRFLENWQDIARVRKPIIAAVSGYAVSGTSALRHGLSSYSLPPTLTPWLYMRSSGEGANSH
jgi:hypothetical protein